MEGLKTSKGPCYFELRNDAKSLNSRTIYMYLYIYICTHCAENRQRHPPIQNQMRDHAVGSHAPNHRVTNVVGNKSNIY